MATGLAGRQIVVTGGGGALGGAVVAALSAAGATCHAPSRDELDLTDEAAVTAYYARLPAVRRHQPRRPAPPARRQPRDLFPLLS
jgi:NAD(P)-dependent dehydrogenase (short-subunit alcohol dehydrogenase family)